MSGRTIHIKTASLSAVTICGNNTLYLEYMCVLDDILKKDTTRLCKKCSKRLAKWVLKLGIVPGVRALK